MKLSDNNAKMTKRDNNVELLRIVLMFMIVILHMISHGLGFIPSLINNTKNIHINGFHFFLFNFTIIGVNSFVLISGYYGINYKKESLIAIWKQALMSSLLILILYYLIEGKAPIRFIVQSFIPILSNYWWYLSTYVLLFILSPFINKSIEKLDQKEFTFLIIMLFLCNCLGGYFFGTFNANEGYSILNFLFLYFLARYCKVYNIFSKLKFTISFYLIVLLINFVIGYFLYQHNYYKYILKFYSYNNPLITLNSVLFVIVFLKMRVNIELRNISKLTLGVYLFHDNDLVRNNLPVLFVENNNVLYVLSVGILIFCGAAFIEFCRQKLSALLEKIPNML
ncbi:TPA: acyltransferase family protein [Elizabethkingia anophelis]